MSNLQVVSRLDPVATLENGELPLWGSPLGGVVFSSFRQAMIAAGYGFHATVGTDTTPITGGGAGTALVIDMPELCISVPSGTAIMPLFIRVDCELPGDVDADVEEILIAVDRTAALLTNGTSTAEVAFNMRSDNPRASVCTVISAVNTAGVTPTPVHGIELARKQEVTNLVTSGITQGKFSLEYEPKRPPIIVGPAMLAVHFGGVTALAGFIQANWLELPSATNRIWGGS